MMRLVAVYQASDELSANTVRDLLRHHEIAAVARCTDLFRTMLLPLPLLLRREWGVVQVQEALGSDVLMCLDVCPPCPVSREDALKAVNMTQVWAERCKATHSLQLTANSSQPESSFGLPRVSSVPASGARPWRG